MSDLTQAVNVTDHATAFVGHTQVFYYGEDFVEVSVVPEADLAALRGGQLFVPARRAVAGRRRQAWIPLARSSLPASAAPGGEPRRCACSAESAPMAPSTSSPTWIGPAHTSSLPRLAAGVSLTCRNPRRSRPRLTSGRNCWTGRGKEGICLVVIAADEAGASRWAQSPGNAAVRLQVTGRPRACGPRARPHGVGELRTAILDHPAFADIWLSAPKAADARRLGGLIVAEPFRSPEQIADEYQGWRTWIDNTLRAKKIGPRTLMWAAAFCDDGQRGSVLRMSEDLRRRLKEDRSPAAVLSDDPASQRLDEAAIKANGDRVHLDPIRHGIAEALRVYLWKEFEDPPLRDLLAKWLVAQLGTLPPDDAERIARGVLDIVIRFRDDSLLRALRDNLTGDKQPIAVRLLSRAAIDPQFGAHVRASLYNWVKDSRSQADLVAAVCGGQFGEQQPEAALVRLGWVAQNSGPDSSALAGALASIATRHPAVVLESIAKWLDDNNRLTAGINAFLALASPGTGAALLCGRADPATGEAGFRDRLIDWFQHSARENDVTYQGTISVLRKWETFSADGTISSEIAIPVLGRGIEPALGKNPMRQLHPGFPDMDSFWGQVFTIAIRGEDPVQETDDPDDPVATPGAPIGQDPQADGSACADPATALTPEATTPETSTPGDPSPTPEAPTWSDPNVDAPSTAPPPQVIPGYDTNTDALVVSGLPADAGTDTDAQAD